MLKIKSVSLKEKFNICKTGKEKYRISRTIMKLLKIDSGKAVRVSSQIGRLG